MSAADSTDWIVSHGSPHELLALDQEKVGVGQGAQGYGWGLYCAECVDVARTYRMPQGSAYHQRLIREGDAIQEEGERMGLTMRYDFDAHEAIFTGGNVPSELQARLDRHNAEFRGHLYTVKILVARSSFLRWESKLSEQSSTVQRILSANAASNVTLRDAIASDITGGALYTDLAAKLYVGEDARAKPKEWANSPAAKATSKFLSAAGIRGIVYRDAESRGMVSGTSNVVLFDGSDAVIIAKDGVPVADSSSSRVATR